MSENIALVKKHQSKFAKKARKLKEKIEANKSLIKDDITPSIAQKVKAKGVGIIYIGHLPHGFYEDQLRAYFKQFGKVRNVIVCRSKLTNRSKGFGFVQFKEEDVAKVAAETMNNYLMFKRRLIAKFIPPEKVKPVMMRRSFWMSESHKSFKAGREKMIRSKNKNPTEAKTKQFVKSKLTQLQKKQDMLNKLGIKYNVTGTL